MVEPPGGLEFALETFEQDLILHHVLVDDLDGHDKTGRAMAAAIDRPHGSLAEPFEKVIIADLGKLLWPCLRQHGDVLRPTWGRERGDASRYCDGRAPATWRS